MVQVVVNVITMVFIRRFIDVCLVKGVVVRVCICQYTVVGFVDRGDHHGGHGGGATCGSRYFFVSAGNFGVYTHQHTYSNHHK